MKLIYGLEKDAEDVDFDKLYPEYIRKLSKIHWTPIEIAATAINWLASSSETKILDIGSGVGKFCILGGILSGAQFTGVEKRENLVQEANKALSKLSIENVNFIYSNITEINFIKYNAFYYFNPFCEQVASGDWIDLNVSFSDKKHRMYEQYVFNQLSKMPLGTMLVTYCSQDFSPPPTYKIHDMMFDGLLVLWARTTI